MEITKPLTLDGEEHLSKAITELMETGTAVLVTRNQKYYGIIDDRNLRHGIADSAKTKCENCVVKPPVLRPDTTILEQINAFLLGHFKALPVVDGDGKPLGITTRTDLLKAMLDEGLVPKNRISELMSSPVYTIDESAPVARAKGMMKEYGCHRLVVTRNGSPVGVISTLDLASYLTKPNQIEKKPYVVKEVDSGLAMPISGYLRADITTIPEQSTIEEAAKRMTDKGVSSVVAVSVSGKGLVGVLSAIDVFRRIQELAKDEVSISVSGLSEDSVWQFPEIKARMGAVLGKFSKSFNIRNVSVHVKEDKSVFEVFLYFDTDEGHVSLSTERKALKEAIDQLADELDAVLLKKKEKKHTKARRVSSGREEEAL
jgi:CBS domain-containing protein